MVTDEAVKRLMYTVFYRERNRAAKLGGCVSAELRRRASDSPTCVRDWAERELCTKCFQYSSLKEDRETLKRNSRSRVL